MSMKQKSILLKHIAGKFHVTNMESGSSQLAYDLCNAFTTVDASLFK